VRVLIAEDDQASALILERTIQRGGHEVTVAADGADALELVLKSSFQAVLVDLVMPRIDGITLIQMIRAAVCPVPILIVTT
jgi:DNA-binding response OmpR family regulator